jgi:hypothetical protein
MASIAMCDVPVRASRLRTIGMCDMAVVMRNGSRACRQREG